jgi:hypothetical protein
LEELQAKRETQGLPEELEVKRKKSAKSTLLEGLGPKRGSLEGSQPPLPPCWTEHQDANSGNPYFANSETGQTQWERPPVPAELPKVTALPAAAPAPAPTPAPAPAPAPAPLQRAKSMSAFIDLPMVFPGLAPDPAVFATRIYKGENAKTMPAKANVLREQNKEKGAKGSTAGVIIETKNREGKASEYWKSIDQIFALKDKLAKKDMEGIKFPTKFKKMKDSKKRLGALNSFLRPLMLRANTTEMDKQRYGKKTMSAVAKEAILAFIYEDDEGGDERQNAEDKKDRDKLNTLQAKLDKLVQEQRGTCECQLR